MGTRRTPRAMWAGTVTMLIGAALPVVTVELAKLPPSVYTRWTAFFVAVLGAVTVAYGHQSRSGGRAGDSDEGE
jgi:hypothetical protein